jgi:purine-binding chemotaxis protein CheW
MSDLARANSEQTMHSFDLPSEVQTFSLGGENYGLDARNVQELRGYNSVTRISGVAEHIKGAINLRGMLVPIVDLRVKLNSGTPTNDHCTGVIVIRIATLVVGLAVDRIHELVSVSTMQVKSHRELDSVHVAPYVTGVGVTDQGRLILLNLASLFAKTELGWLKHFVA